jgi:translation initiation factor IF-1
MPKKINMAKRVAAETKNKNAVAAALDGTVTIIGRVEKALGNGSFQVALGGGKMVQGLIRGVFKGGAKSEAFLAPGMFVILAEGTGRSMVHEVLGVINKKKDMKALKSAGLVPASLCDDTAADDLFDYADAEEGADLEGDDRKAYDRVVAKHAAARSGVKDALEALVPAAVAKPIKPAKVSAPSGAAPKRWVSVSEALAKPKPAEEVAVRSGPRADAPVCNGVWAGGISEPRFQPISLPSFGGADWESVADDEIDIDAI